MADHTCIRCGYETKKAGNMKQHLTRKTICEPDISDDIPAFEEYKRIYIKTKNIIINCEKCQKGFTSKRGHAIHTSNCTVEHTPLIPTLPLVPTAGPSGAIITTNSVAGPSGAIIATNSAAGPSGAIITTNSSAGPIITPEMEALIDKKVEEKLNEFMKKHPTIVLNANLNISVLGYEDVRYILNDIDFMKSCMKNDVLGLIQYINRKWFSDHPTNSNIKIIDPDTATIEYYSYKKTWIKSKLGNNMTRNITNSVADDYRYFFENHPTVFDHKFIDKLMKTIGTALGWDLDHDGYVYKDDRKISEEQYVVIANEIWKQTREAILNLHKNKQLF